MGKKINFRYAVFLALIALCLIFLQFSFSGFADPDSYYHVKFSEIISSQGWSAVSGLPWVEFSVWKNFPADLSLGYHYLFAVFLWFFHDSIFAAKIFGTLISFGVCAVFLVTLLRLKIRHPLIWMFLLFLGSSAFLCRLMIIRPVIFSIILLLLGFLFALGKRRWALFLTAFFHSLIHASTVPFLIFVVAIVLFFQKELPLKKKVFLFFFCLGGAIFGLILRPDFPFIFYQLFIQDWYVLFYQWQGLDLGQGNEIHDSGLNLFSSSFLTLAVFFAMIFILAIKKKIFIRSLSGALLIISLIFFLMSAFSFRYIDYFIPFAVLFAALAAKPVLEKININDYLRKWREKHKTPLVLACAFIALLVLKNFVGAFSSVRATEPLEKFQAAAFWLKENTPKNSIVFHTDWDDFPKLFYYNDRNRYLVGLDPTFMYEYDKKIYWLWRNISDSGVVSDHSLSQEEKNEYKKFQDPKLMAQTIKNKFSSDVIFAPKERALLNELLLNSPDQFKEIYNDQWVKIFKVL